MECLRSCRAVARRKNKGRAIKDNGLPKDVSLRKLKWVTLLPYKLAGTKSQFLRLIVMNYLVGVCNYKMEAGE